MLRRLPLLALLFLLSVVLLRSYSLQADEQDSHFLTGLRQRRLFELAERYCRERLGRPQLSDGDRVDLTRELIRTLALHAANSPTAERESRWQAARKVAQEFSQEHPKHPRRALVQLQDALTLLLQGEFLQQELTAAVAIAKYALPSLREAIRRLAELNKQLDADIHERRQQPPAVGELTAGELADLQQQVQEQQARALRALGLCYPEKDENRISSLLQAAELLKKALSHLTLEDPRAARLQLELAICHRHLGQADGAEPLLTRLTLPGVPALIQARALGERVRWLLLRGDLAGAFEQLKSSPPGVNSPELDFARLEATTAQWKNALEANDREAEALQKQCLALARSIEETHGDAWGRRANQWLVRYAPRTAAAAAELLGKAADQLYLQGQLEDAVAAYDQAADQALASQNSKAAFELSYKGALIQQKRKDYRGAAERLRKLALAHKNLPAAADAHCQAGWNLAQALRSDQALTGEYVDLLTEHLGNWPQGEPADQIRLWLGRFKESEQTWDEALAAYRGVPRTSPHFSLALAGAIHAGDRQLETLHVAGNSTDTASREAILYYEQAIAGDSDQLPQKWTEADGQAAVAAAKVVLGYRTNGYDAAELLLTAAVAGLPEAPAGWRREAQSLLVAALAVQPGKRTAAEQMLNSLADATPQALLSLLDTLTLVARRSRPEAAREIASLQLQAVERLWPNREKLGLSVQPRLERVRAECLVSTGQFDEALIVYSRLAQNHPQDGDVQEGYASLLTSRSDKTSLQNGLDQWRRVASKSPSRTPRWWRAKFAVAETQYKLGDKAGTAKLIRYLVEVPPGLEGSELKDQFLALLKRCGG